MTLHDSDFTQPGSDREQPDRAGGDDRASTELLGGIRRSETIADRVDFESLRSELPDDWGVTPDLVQFGSEPIAEALRFRRTRTDPQLVLKPADSTEPGGEIQFYERSEARAPRRRTMTVESLTEALRVAVNRVHQFEG